MIYIHPDGYRAEVHPTATGWLISVTRLNWEPGRVEHLPIKSDTLPLTALTEWFGDGWKESRNTR